MHIALVSTFYYPNLRGGAEHSLQYLAESLVQRGLKVSVFSFHEEVESKRFEHNGVMCHTLPAPHLAQCLNRKQNVPAPTRMLWHVLDIYNPAAGRLLEKELREIRPDLVQFHNLPGWSCSAWNAARRLKLPYLQVLHDFQLTCPPATRFRNNENCKGTCASCVPFATVRRRFSHKVSHLVANSCYTREVHRDLGFFGGAKSFDVIYGAVPPPAARAASTKADGQLRIGYLGRLHATKGIELLIDSFIAAKRSDAVLQIAGSGTESYESELRQRAHGHPVEFLGSKPSAEFLPSLDILVVPSLWNEPMGRVVIEAATQGVPVIAASRGGIPELVKEGKTGWLFDPSTPIQLTELLCNLKKEKLPSLRQECEIWAREFSPVAISAQWISLYQRLLPPTESVPHDRNTVIADEAAIRS